MTQRTNRPPTDAERLRHLVQARRTAPPQEWPGLDREIAWLRAKLEIRKMEAAQKAA